MNAKNHTIRPTNQSLIKYKNNQTLIKYICMLKIRMKQNINIELKKEKALV